MVFEFHELYVATNSIAGKQKTNARVGVIGFNYRHNICWQVLSDGIEIRLDPAKLFYSVIFSGILVKICICCLTSYMCKYIHFILRALCAFSDIFILKDRIFLVCHPSSDILSAHAHLFM